MGGLDIFVAELSPDGKASKAVENLKYPINSSFDDFGIVYEGKKQKGYLTSNREGGKGDDDIWSFVLPPLVFNGKGLGISKGGRAGAGAGEPVEVVKVKIVGSDGTINESVTGKDGSYNFKLKENTTYTITTETGKDSKSATHNKKGFLASKDSRVITTVGEPVSKDFIADFQLGPIEDEIRMPEIRYDLGKWELRPEAKDSLLFLYQTMVDNPAIVCELNSHTDSRGDAKKNQELSQKRAQSCVDFLVNEKKIAPARLVAKGYGKSMLLVGDDVIKNAKTKEEKEALHQKNRRTSFRILNWDYVDPNKPKTEAPKVKPKVEGEDED
jgi:peptidoglycan-associated lipoprotein